MHHYLGILILAFSLLRISAGAAPLCEVIFTHDARVDKYADLRHSGALDVYLDVDRRWVSERKPLPPFQAPSSQEPQRLGLEDIHFMQNNVSNNHADNRYTVVENARAIRDGILDPETFPPLRVWRDSSGKVWTLDHRRLVAFILSGRVTSVRVEWAPRSEVKKQSYKMSTLSEGNYIILTDKIDQALMVSKNGATQNLETQILPTSLLPIYKNRISAKVPRQTSFREVDGHVPQELLADEILFSTEKTDSVKVWELAKEVKDRGRPTHLFPLRVWMDSVGRTWTLDNEALAVLRMADYSGPVKLRYISAEEFRTLQPLVDSQSGGHRWQIPLDDKGKQVLIIH